MSAGDSSVTVGEPQKHTGAQILLQMTPPKHTGFLRKRGKRERVLENFRFAKSFLSRLLRWRQRFVVVSHGCIYVFTSETASSPLSSFSLTGYNKLVVMESEQSPWTFRITAPEESFKIHYFACHSDEDRKIWMTAIRDEMMNANNIRDDRISGGSIGSDFYVYLQKPIFEPPPKPKTSDDASDTDSVNSDYDKIDEKDLEKLRPRKPVFPLPQIPDSYKEVNKPKKDHPDYVNRPMNVKPSVALSKKPAPKPKPTKAVKSVSRTPSESEYFFPENDREKALSILRGKQQTGTYLVRKSRASENKVLAVITEDDIKEYKILTKDNKVTINNKTYYKSVEDLLVAYQRTPLPNRTTTLTRAFSTQDLSV